MKASLKLMPDPRRIYRARFVVRCKAKKRPWKFSFFHLTEL
jgi:hypothetical protein